MHTLQYCSHPDVASPLIAHAIALRPIDEQFYCDGLALRQLVEQLAKNVCAAHCGVTLALVAWVTVVKRPVHMQGVEVEHQRPFRGHAVGELSNAWPLVQFQVVVHRRQNVRAVLLRRQLWQPEANVQVTVRQGHRRPSTAEEVQLVLVHVDARRVLEYLAQILLDNVDDAVLPLHHRQQRLDLVVGRQVAVNGLQLRLHVLPGRPWRNWC